MSKIEWTDATWNPVVGCSPVSEGCRNCYAAKEAIRLGGNPNEKISTMYAGTSEMRGAGSKRRAVFTGRVNLVPDRLDQPLRWRKPRRVFVNSMSDLFHESVPFEFIDRVFAVMALCPQHTFQVLTKRPERMAEYLNKAGAVRSICVAADEVIGSLLPPVGDRDEFDPSVVREWKSWYRQFGGADHVKRLTAWTQGGGAAEEKFIREGGGLYPSWINWPLPNVQLGTSVEDQAAADERIPHLLRTPAAVRFLSCEPLLGPVDIDRAMYGDAYRYGMNHFGHTDGFGYEALIHWVIVGGESGPGARPCDVAWIRSIKDQCQAAGVPVFVKQLGARPLVTDPPGARMAHWHDDLRLRDRKGGDPAEWPEDLRVREYPQEGR